MKNNLIYLLLILSFFACTTTELKDEGSRVESLPFYDEATFTPHWLATNDPALKSFHRISPFELTNQDGETITNKTFEGKIYITDFFFTSCAGICPKMTSNMTAVQEAFIENEDVLILSHSVTPSQDSVATLKRYADNNGVVSSKWHLVTGSQAEIYAFGRQDYFIEEDLGLEKSADEFLHTENFVLIDRQGHIRGIYNGLNKTSVRQLITDVETLLLEE